MALLHKIDSLFDVTVASPQSGEVIKFTGAAWINSRIAFNNLQDIPPYPSLSGGYFLVYDQISGTFSWQNISSGGYFSKFFVGGLTGLVHEINDSGTIIIKGVDGIVSVGVLPTDIEIGLNKAGALEGETLVYNSGGTISWEPAISIASGSSGLLQYDATTRQLSAKNLLITDVTVDVISTSMAAWVTANYTGTNFQEGDILILSNTSSPESWIHNGNTANTIADWSQLSTLPNNYDSIFRVSNISDPTKKMAFDVSGVTTGTTRTYTAPNASGTLGLLERTQTWTGINSFGSVNIGGGLSVNSIQGTASTFPISRANSGTTMQLTGGASSTLLIDKDVASGGTNGYLFNTNTVSINPVGTPSSIASAQFSVGGTTKGSVPAPIMTTTQRDAIVSPVAGLQIYNTTTLQPEFFNGTIWVSTILAYTGIYAGSNSLQQTNTLASMTTSQNFGLGRFPMFPDRDYDIGEYGLYLSKTYHGEVSLVNNNNYLSIYDTSVGLYSDDASSSSLGFITVGNREINSRIYAADGKMTAIKQYLSGILLSGHDSSFSIKSYTLTPSVATSYPSFTAAARSTLVYTGTGTTASAAFEIIPAPQTALTSTYVPYSNGTTFVGTPNFIWDNTNTQLRIGNPTADGLTKLQVNGGFNTKRYFFIDRTAGNLVSYLTGTVRDAGEAGGLGTGLLGQTELFAYNTGGLAIGTQNGGPLVLATSGTPRMWINSTGQVGVGAATPTGNTAFNIENALGGTAGGMYIGTTNTSGISYASILLNTPTGGQSQIFHTNSTYGGYQVISANTLGFYGNASTTGGFGAQLDYSLATFKIGIGTSGTVEKFKVSSTDMRATSDFIFTYGATTTNPALKINSANAPNEVVTISSSTYAATIGLGIGNNSNYSAGNAFLRLNGISWYAHPGNSSLFLFGTSQIMKQGGGGLSLLGDISGTQTGDLISVGSNNVVNNTKTNHTSGIVNMLRIYPAYGGGYGDFNPASGTGVLNGLLIAPTYNTTGSYSGTARGIYYNPTLTSTTGMTHRAWESTSGDIVVNSGKVYIGVTSPSGTIPLNVAASTSTDNIVSLTNSAGLVLKMGLGTGIDAEPGFSYIQLNSNYIKSTGDTYEFTNVGKITNGNGTRTFEFYGAKKGTSVGDVFSFRSYGQYTAESFNPTTGELNFLNVNQVGSYTTFNPSSGNASFNSVKIATHFSPSGSYAGIARGVYYNPTMLTTTGLTHNAWESTAGNMVITNGLATVNNTAGTRMFTAQNSSLANNRAFLSDDGIYFSRTSDGAPLASIRRSTSSSLPGNGSVTLEYNGSVHNFYNANSGLIGAVIQPGTNAGSWGEVATFSAARVFTDLLYATSNSPLTIYSDDANSTGTTGVTVNRSARLTSAGIGGVMEWQYNGTKVARISTNGHLTLGPGLTADATVGILLNSTTATNMLHMTGTDNNGTRASFIVRTSGQGRPGATEVMINAQRFVTAYDGTFYFGTPLGFTGTPFAINSSGGSQLPAGVFSQLAYYLGANTGPNGISLLGTRSSSSTEYNQDVSYPSGSNYYETMTILSGIGVRSTNTGQFPVRANYRIGGRGLYLNNDEGVVISNGNPTTSVTSTAAALDIQSATQGFLPPRLSGTSALRYGIASVVVTAGGSGYGTGAGVVITFSGGSGSGAAISLTYSGGVITGGSVILKGTGYSSAPTVTLTGGTGTGAVVTVTLEANPTALTYYDTTLGRYRFWNGSAWTDMADMSTPYFPLAGGTLTGTAGAGFLGLPAQGSNPSTPASGFSVFANGAHNLAIKDRNGWIITLDISASADRIFTFPSTGGTFGILERTQTWTGVNTFTPASGNAITTTTGNVVLSNTDVRINNPTGTSGEGDTSIGLNVRGGSGLGAEGIFNVGGQSITQSTTGYYAGFQVYRSGGTFSAKTNLTNGLRVGQYSFRGQVNGSSIALGNIGVNYTGSGTTTLSELYGQSSTTGGITTGWRLDDQSRFWLASGGAGYYFPTTTPSVTNTVKQVQVWTGNGTVATPAWENFNGATIYQSNGTLSSSRVVDGGTYDISFGTGTAGNLTNFNIYADQIYAYAEDVSGNVTESVTEPGFFSSISYTSTGFGKAIFGDVSSLFVGTTPFIGYTGNHKNLQFFSDRIIFGGKQTTSFTYDMPVSSVSVVSGAKSIMQWEGTGTSAPATFIPLKSDLVDKFTDIDYNLLTVLLSSTDVKTKYNNIIVTGVASASSTSNSILLLPTPTSDYDQVTIKLFCIKQHATNTVEISTTTNKIIVGDGTYLTNYVLAAGQFLEIRAIIDPTDSNNYKWALK